MKLPILLPELVFHDAFTDLLVERLVEEWHPEVDVQQSPGGRRTLGRLQVQVEGQGLRFQPRRLGLFAGFDLQRLQFFGKLKEADQVNSQYQENFYLKHLKERQTLPLSLLQLRQIQE